MFGFNGNNGNKGGQNSNGNSGGNEGNSGNDREERPGNKGAKGNGEDNVDDNMNIWDDPDNKDGNKGNKGGGGNGNDGNGDRGNPVDPNKQVEDYLNSLGLDLDMSDDIMEAARNGDFAGMKDAIGASNKKLYKQFLKDSGRMMDATVSRAVEAAVTKALGTVNTSSLVKRMNADLPFTKDPNVAPIAQSVLGRMMKHYNGDEEKAISNTKAFFKKMQGLTANDLGGDAPGGRPGNRRYGNNGGNEADWLSVLSGEEDE